MTWQQVTSTILAALFLLMLGIFNVAGAQSQTTAGRAKALEAEKSAIQQNVYEEVETRSPDRAVEIVEYRMQERRLQYDRLEEILGKTTESSEAIAHLKQKTEDRGWYGLADLGEDVAQKTIEAPIVAYYSKFGHESKRWIGRSVFWAGLVIDGLEIGGKILMFHQTLDRLEELAASNQLNAQEIIILQTALLNDNNADREILRRFERLRDRYHEILGEQHDAEDPGTENNNDRKDRTTPPDEMIDACSYVPDARARKACYEMFERQCKHVNSDEGQERCKKALRAGGIGGRLWDFCARMPTHWREKCYSFGATVKGLCELIPPGPEKAECLRNVAKMPESMRLVSR